MAGGGPATEPPLVARPSESGPRPGGAVGWSLDPGLHGKRPNRTDARGREAGEPDGRTGGRVSTVPGRLVTRKIERVCRTDSCGPRRLRETGRSARRVERSGTCDSNCGSRIEGE